MTTKLLPAVQNVVSAITGAAGVMAMSGLFDSCLLNVCFENNLLTNFMAQTLGQEGRYVTDEAARKKRNILIIVLTMIVIFGMIEGIVVASYFPPMPFNGWLRGLIFVLLLVLLVSLSKWADVKLNTLEREQKKYERGAQGENAVAKELKRFPNSFHVLHDLKTEYGNLDHVVIGPTGVYVLDAKNNRGIISADGKGGLLQNGKSAANLETKKLVGRTMSIKEKVDTLTGNADTYFQVLYVFTSAWVEPIWGKTGAVICLTEDQLYKYIVEKDFGTKLKPEQVEKTARAFAQLAHMEVDFTEKAVGAKAINPPL